MRVPTPAVLVLPSLKAPGPRANVPPASVIGAVLLIWLLAPRNRVPPEFTVIALVKPSALPEPFARVSVPPFTVVAPVKVFAPDRVQVPVPLLVSEPEVVPIILEMLPLPAPASVSPNVAPVIVPALVRLSVPLLEERVVAPASVSNPP